MKLFSDFKGYEIHVPTSGGKAGKGCNKTCSIQVRANGCIVKQVRFTVGKQVRFTVGKPGAMESAVKKVKAWIAIDSKLHPLAQRPR